MRKAHDRNRVRRLLKEAYRLNKLELTQKSSRDYTFLSILFSLTPEGYNIFGELSFKGLAIDMRMVLKEIERPDTHP